MSFFGIRWLAHTENDLKVSESDPIELSKLVYNIRCEGKNAAAEAYAQNQQEYTRGYYYYTEMQELVSSKENQLNKLLKLVDDESKKNIEKAAKYKIEENSNYHIILKSMNVKHKNVLEQYYIPFLQLKKQFEEMENSLWMKHMALQTCQKVYDLWAFEASVAEKYTQELKEKLNLEEKKRSWQMAAFDDRLREIRSKNREKQKEKRKMKKTRNPFVHAEVLNAAAETVVSPTIQTDKKKNEKIKNDQNVSPSNASNFFFKFIGGNEHKREDTKISGYDWL